MVPEALLFDSLSLFVYPVKMLDASGASTITNGHCRMIYPNRGNFTSCVRFAGEAFAPVIYWFGKVLKY
jgi:hypothetical protein